MYISKDFKSKVDNFNCKDITIAELKYAYSVLGFFRFFLFLIFYFNDVDLKSKNRKVLKKENRKNLSAVASGSSHKKKKKKNNFQKRDNICKNNMEKKKERVNSMKNKLGKLKSILSLKDKRLLKPFGKYVSKLEKNVFAQENKRRLRSDKKKRNPSRLKRKALRAEKFKKPISFYLEGNFRFVVRLRSLEIWDADSLVQKIEKSSEFYDHRNILNTFLYSDDYDNRCSFEPDKETLIAAIAFY